MARPKVFLSYDRADVKAAEKLRKSLEERGVRVWSDRDLKPGTHFPEVVERAIQDADAVILLIGPKQSETPWQQIEWQAALKAAWQNPQKRLVPVLIDDAKLPAFLSDRVAVKPLNGAKQWNAAVDEIAEVIKTDQPPPLRPPTPAERAARENRLSYIEEIARAMKARRPI